MSIRKSPRISWREAKRYLQPFMSKSTWYGTRERPGPRWTMVERLDIREGPPLTMDRDRFFAWLRELAGDLAYEPQDGVHRRRRG